MKFKSILATGLAAVVAFSSCSKEDNPGTTPENGAEAKMDLVITFPDQTRAADGNASAGDVKVKDVTVFIFNTDGTKAAGNATTKLKAAFTANAATNSYSLLEAERITTTAGAKRIYVGINLPASLQSADSEAKLKEEFAATVATLVTTDGIAMLSAVKEETLAAQEINSTPTVNKVSVSVERLVSKVAVNKSVAGSGTVGDATKGRFTVTPDQFAVGNLATAIYPIQQWNGAKLVTPMKNSTTIETMVALNANGADKTANGFKSFYVPEHRPASNLRKEATFAMIRAAFSFTDWADLNAAKDGVELSTSDYTTGKFWVVRTSDNSNTYFCKDQATANAVAGVTANASSPVEYGGLYCFYYIFLNNDDTLGDNQLAVKRNQFFDITVGSINGLGLAGDVNNPEEPTPVIPDPELPIIETAAYLEVIVDVVKWDMVTTTTDLE